MSEDSTTQEADNRILAVIGKYNAELKSKYSLNVYSSLADGTESFVLEDINQLDPLMSDLRNKKDFSTLNLINVIEYKEVFQVVYQLQKLNPVEYLVIRCNLNKANPQINSICQIWDSANWYEREMWDMHGIIFNGHPNLTRILNPENWADHPLRKDYIPPVDALNGPITAVKGHEMKNLSFSSRGDVEKIS
jgi:NADH:ubiquinone oxidoreductase subunit C